MKADYEMTKASRFVRKRTGVTARGSGEDYHFRIETSYYSSMEQARDMAHNDATIGMLADRRVDNIIQSGFTLSPNTGDKGVDDELFYRWRDFAEDPEQCDIACELTWHEMEQIACRSTDIDGDIVMVGTQEGSFQMIEAHLIQTKTKRNGVFLGVEKNEYGKREKYWIVEEKDEFGTFGEERDIDVRNEDGIRQLFHLYHPRRVLSTRGVTALAPIMRYAGMFEDINFAKLVQQQVASCFAIIRQRAANAPLPGAGSYGQTSTEQTSTGQNRTSEGVSPGMEFIGSPGETLSGFSPNVPNLEYFMQVKLILQILGVNFGLPLCLVLMDGSETNFSGWRGAVDEARKGFVADQQNIARRFHKPAYQWWIYKHILPLAEFKNRADTLDLYRHDWGLPKWSYIEPVADAEGDATQLRNALTSPRRLHHARGNDWEEVSEEIIEDNLYAIQRAAARASEFNAKFSSMPPLTWRDLISLPMPEGQTLSLQDPNLVANKAKPVKGVTNNA